MPTIENIRDSSTFYLVRAGGDRGMGEGGWGSPVRGSNPCPVPNSGFLHK